MHFSDSLLIAGLIAFASASPAPAPEPTTPSASQTQALVDDLQSYILDLATQPIVSSLATDTAAISSLDSLQASLLSDVRDGETPNTSVLTALPSPLASFIGSIYTAELSIASKNGFGDLIASATATEAASASATGASQTASGTQKTSTTAGSASASSSAPVTVETGAAGALGVDMLKICGGLAVGIVGAVMAL
ncbi:uncharacterized protein EAE97_003383 [Botrytis byssoidea]|uniref:FAS1 domain-containing protein n=1 Tax=Botrytis byssoidea TaxID=139641 RepID=A0A9P5IWL9_9HELO|nr:uncharacterized protein EAE97_003383 [Botrytis byssoidea]KAF7949874.1 hypothetical protein EAE97_003383 [Botrytis byssoidea]